MSLAQHLTPEDGLECTTLCLSDGNLATTDTPCWRRMSSNACTQPVKSFSPDAQYKTSAFCRIVQVGFTVTFCVLASGIVFGFAALKLILIANGTYHKLCHEDNYDAGSRADAAAKAVRTYLNSHSSHSGTTTPCPQQDLRLNLLFIVASITTNVSSLFAGVILDILGRRICVTLSAAFLAIGSLSFILNTHIYVLDGYLVANFFLSLGGTFVFLPSFQLSNAFPRHSGIVVAMITCGFDASSAIFLVYQKIWKATGGSFTPEKFFTAYLLVPLVITIVEWSIMPARQYHTMSELEQKLLKAQDSSRHIHASDETIPNDPSPSRVQNDSTNRRTIRIGQSERITGDAEDSQERSHQRTLTQVHDEAWDVLHGLSLKEQMKTHWFAFLLLNTAFQMLRMNYFIATIATQYSSMLLQGQADQVVDLFNFALPIGGIAATPAVAIILNIFGITELLVLLSCYTATIGLFNCVSTIWAGQTTVILFATFRPLYYSIISHIAAKVFGLATFGRVYGTIVCLSGVFNCFQPSVNAITTNLFHGNALPVNIAMGVIGTALAVVFTVYVNTKIRHTVKAPHSEYGRLLPINYTITSGRR